MVKFDGRDGEDGGLGDRREALEDVVSQIFEKAGMVGCGSFASPTGGFVLKMVREELVKAGYPEVSDEQAQSIADTLLRFKEGVERTIHARRAGVTAAVRRVLQLSGRFDGWEKAGHVVLGERQEQES